ncbi:MAG: hypothetical protein JW940_17545 [Polyangiaceae bacterium]|nr:hypothetical protein [Polyangiaceae bacterium]
MTLASAPSIPWAIVVALVLVSESSMAQLMPSTPGQDKTPPAETPSKSKPPAQPRPRARKPVNPAIAPCVQAGGQWQADHCECTDPARAYDDVTHSCECRPGTHEQDGACASDAPPPEPAPLPPPVTVEPAPEEAPPPPASAEPEPAEPPSPEPAEPEQVTTPSPEPEPAAYGPPEVDEGPRSSRGGPLRTIGLVTSAMGVGGLAVGMVFGLQAKAKERESEDHCEPDDPTICSHAGADLIRKAKRDAKVANVAFATGGGALVLGLVLYLAAPGDGSSGSAAVRPSRGLRFSPRVGTDATWLTVDGRF